MIVPASTKIHYKRVRNIDTDRLQRRLAWLNENKFRLAREASHQMKVRHLAREILTIEAELEKRDGLAS